MSQQDAYTAIPVAKVVEDGSDEQASLLYNNKPSSSAGKQPLMGAYGQQEFPGDIEKQLRRGFVRKVYSILFIQMLVTAGSVALFISNDDVMDYVQTNPWVMYTSIGLYFFSAIAIICCGELRRKHPHGLICLSVLTIALSVMVGIVSAQYQTETVLWAALTTSGCVAGLTMYACQTKYDFTMMGGMLSSMIFVFIMSWFILWWFPITDTVSLVYSSLGALLMCFFIVYDTQLMLGGKHKLAIGLDEYVFAALNLYLDIINLFLYILQILGGSRR